MRLRSPRVDVDAVLADLGGRIAQLRIEQDISQEDLAARSGIDYKRIQKIERGKANITIRTLVRIATALDVPFTRLVGGNPMKRRS